MQEVPGGLRNKIIKFFRIILALSKKKIQDCTNKKIINKPYCVFIYCLPPHSCVCIWKKKNKEQKIVLQSIDI